MQERISRNALGSLLRALAKKTEFRAAPRGRNRQKKDIFQDFVRGHGEGHPRGPALEFPELLYLICAS